MQQHSLRDDARVIGLVGLAHALSHFFHLIVAGLFPWLKVAFALSYAECGFLMTVFFVVSGLGQAAAGFVVDRLGARNVLFAGLALLAASAFVLAAAPSYGMLVASSMLAGLGNSVFHPADYALLNQRVARARLAHAFSVHGISGNLGWAAGPLFLAAVASVAGWRAALMAAGVLPVLVLLLLVAQRAHLRVDPVRAAASGAAAGTFDFLRLPAVWMCFGFFFLTACGMGGIQGFAGPSLVKLYGVSLASATTAYTLYMLASAAGMACGGFLAARAGNPDRTIAIAFLIAAGLALLIAAGVLAPWMPVPVMGMIGFAAGVAGPSRDLLIRAAAPRNATGRVFGVVYSGLDCGLALGPLAFGAIMDAGQPAWVFIGIAVFQCLAIATAVGVGGKGRAPLPQSA